MEHQVAYNTWTNINIILVIIIILLIFYFIFKYQYKQEYIKNKDKPILQRGYANITAQMLVDLWATVGWISGSASFPQRLLEALQKSDFVITIWINRELIGVCMCIDNGMQVFISHCIVHNDYQNKGYGKMLLEEVKKHYTSHEVYVDTRKAKSFYEQNSFVLQQRDTLIYDSRHKE